LAWEKGNSGPEEKVFTEWLESVKENPAVIDFEVRLKSIEVRVLKQCARNPNSTPYDSFSIFFSGYNGNIFL
jgi:hypothetical protein